MTTHPTPTPPVPSIELGPGGATARVDRIVAGVPIELTWPAEGTPERAFLGKVIRWAYEPDITVGDLYNLVYGVQNPLLDATEAGSALVTLRAGGDPAWALMGELIDRKRAAVGHLDVDAARARFTMPVSEAALRLEMSGSAVRQLIDRGRLVARKEGASYLLDPASVEAYRSIRRGPASRRLAVVTLPRPDLPTSDDPAAVAVRIGHEDGYHVRIHGAEILNSTVEDVNGSKVITGVLKPGWTRLYVLSYRDDGAARLFILVPAGKDALPYEWRFGKLGLRGMVCGVAHVNNPKHARRRFDAAVKAAAGANDTE
jgi:hypothetical protein